MGTISDGDVHLTMLQDGLPIGGTDVGDPEQESASLEVCTSPMRSPNTYMALLGLMEAMRRDNEERPIHGQSE